MQNTFTPKAIAIVKQAIDFDNLGEYEKALELYRKALDFFMTGLKYEQNPTSRKMIMERVEGYMKRAEEIKGVLASQNGPPPSKDSGGGGAKTANKNDAKNKDDDEQSKMRGALSSAIVSEKPNIKWDDVAGLEGAKEALKEGLDIPQDTTATSVATGMSATGTSNSTIVNAVAVLASSSGDAADGGLCCPQCLQTDHRMGLLEQQLRTQSALLQQQASEIAALWSRLGKEG